ncbi:MAG: CNP1-like family protein [Burkholderiales bacterium]
MRRAAPLLVLLAGALLGGCAAPAANDQSDWEREREETSLRNVDVAPPAFPRERDLISFSVSAASDFKFFIDGASIAPAADGVVRYVLEARSRQGARTVNFEGIRCQSGEYRIYATGTDAGEWIRRPSPWRQIKAGNDADRWHEALAIEYFCPLGVPIRSRAEGVDALRRGVSPRRAPSES